MKRRKRWMAAALILLVVCSLAACGRSGAGGSDRSDGSATGATAETASTREPATETADPALSNSTAEEAAAEGDTAPAAEEEGNAQYTIAIDAGHQAQGNFSQEPIGPGASETKYKVAGGTSGVSTGVPEYQLTLDIALQLEEELEDRGYNVVMIRTTSDVDISNAERAQIANDADADVFIRLHANGSESSSANGAMTICQTASNPYNGSLHDQSYALSEEVLDAYTEATGIRKEYVWETDTMSGINWCQVPVTILEMGYMTNPAEDEKMEDDAFQQTMVQGIADGIEAYLKTAAKEEDGGALAIAGAQEALEEYVSGKTGTYSIYLKRMDSKEAADINASAQLPSASLIKLYIAGCYMDEAENGVIRDSYRESLDAMLEQSDNDAANRLIDLLGMNAVNAFIEKQGAVQTHLGRRMLEASQDDNYTSAQDCGQILESILEGTYVSEEASEYLLEDLKKQTRTGKIPAGVPEEVRTANKTGELSVSGYAVQHDAAIVWAPGGTYILVVMVEDGGGEGTMVSSIQEISRLVYETIGTKEAMEAFQEEATKEQQ